MHARERACISIEVKNVNNDIQIADLPKGNIAVRTDPDGCTVAVKFYRGDYISVVVADGSINESDSDILRARRELVEMGLVFDSGRRRLNSPAVTKLCGRPRRRRVASISGDSIDLPQK